MDTIKVNRLSEQAQVEFAASEINAGRLVELRVIREGFDGEDRSRWFIHKLTSWVPDLEVVEHRILPEDPTCVHIIMRKKGT